ncbi:MAG: HIT family protein [Patescibacteria group bacterium]
MSDCIFCKIAKGEIPSNKIYEDEDFMAILDIAPVNPGHTLVVPKIHCDDLINLPDDLAQKSILVIKKIVPAILKGVEAGGFNLTINHGVVAGQIVPHLHWHIMPRFPGDGWDLWHGKAYPEGEVDKVLEKIKNNI